MQVTHHHEMRVEFRNSGGKTCETCDSHELIGTAKNGTTIEKDLWETIEPNLNKFELAILRLCRERAVEHEAIAQHEIERTRKRIVGDHLEYEETVEALFAEEAPRYRLLKRRWMRGLREEFDLETQKLRDKTSKV